MGWQPRGRSIYGCPRVSEARARHAGLLALPATPDANLHSLEALGHWLTRFSPNICVSPPASLFLDAMGLERLYGGLDNFHRRVSDALASLRITASVVIAPTPGAAWALAAFGNGRMPIVSHDQMPETLAALPPEALRLEGRAVEILRALGITTIRSLLQLPRGDLAARFGPAILRRIDQAMGAVHEPLLFLPHRSPVGAMLEFEGTVESLDAIGLAARELIRETVMQLTRRGLGARGSVGNLIQQFTKE